MSVKVLNVGSMGGLTAAKRGECDLAPVHLMDPATGRYNEPFLAPGLTLVPGYRRLRASSSAKAIPASKASTAPQALTAAASLPDCLMINRNPGSGTRILTDRLLGRREAPRLPGPGQIPQRRRGRRGAGPRRLGRRDLDGGRRLRPGLPAAPARALRLHDPTNRLDRPAVRAFIDLLAEPETGRWLEEKGFSV